MGIKDVNRNNIRDVLSELKKGANEAGVNIPTVFKQKDFASSYESRINQTPAPSNKKVQFIDVDVRGETMCIQNDHLMRI